VVLRLFSHPVSAIMDDPGRISRSWRGGQRVILSLTYFSARVRLYRILNSIRLVSQTDSSCISPASNGGLTAVIPWIKSEYSRVTVCVRFFICEPLAPPASRLDSPDPPRAPMSNLSFKCVLWESYNMFRVFDRPIRLASLIVSWLALHRSRSSIGPPTPPFC
jgi:hypothetical protein